jgi:hypothetical protein
MAATPDWPVDDFADEVRACVRALRRYDMDAEELGRMVKCPTLTDDVDEDGRPKACGYRLHYRDWHEQVTCRRCKVTRDAATLVAVAMSDPDADIWTDHEAITTQFGVTQQTLRKWARRGLIPPARNGLYSISAVSHVLNGVTA